MRYYLLLILLIFLLPPKHSYSQGSKNQLNSDFVLSLQNVDPDSKEKETGGIAFPVRLGYQAMTTNKSINFPPSFDLRDLGLVPPVKTQSSGGCWAYSSMSTVEARQMFLGEGFQDLSDNNLKYCHGFFPGRSTNGNAWMTTAYLARQSGPLLEEQDPFPGGTSEPGVDCPEDEAPAFFVRDARYPIGELPIIKQLIMDIGSVWSLIYYHSDYFNDMDDTYFYGGTHAVNHVLNIVGWDDHIVTDGGIGAWICQNTYGLNWGDNGFVYVSYQDSQFLIYNAYYPNYQSYHEDSRVLSYDELGNYNSYGFEAEIGYALVKYPIHEPLFLEELGTYAMAYGTEIEVEIYSHYDEGSGVLSGLLGGISPKVTDHPGYYTYQLDHSFAVQAGDDIFVKVKYTTPGYEWPIPVEHYIETYADPFIESNVSWISEDGVSNNWLAIGSNTENDFDLCIKVYGQFNPMTIPISNTSMIVLIGLIGLFIYKKG